MFSSYVTALSLLRILSSALLWQSLVAPGAYLLLLHDQKNLVFSYKLDAGHPRFYSFRNAKTVKSRLLAPLNFP